MKVAGTGSHFLSECTLWGEGLAWCYHWLQFRSQSRRSEKQFFHKTELIPCQGTLIIKL